MNDPLYTRAREHALYLLERRDYSKAELLHKLTRPPRNQKKQPIDENTAKKVLENLSELGLIDDARFAAKLARHLLFDMKYGIYKAATQMRYKGIPSGIVENALEEYSKETENYSPVDKIKGLVKTKYARRLKEENGYKKVVSALYNRGFSYDDIKIALQEIEDEQEI
jgi:Uncharacterized protein conserved in bacteria